MPSSCDSATALLKVVIVEDSRNTQEALQDLIDSLGSLQVVAVEPSAATAMEWAIHHKGGWDIAIIDLILADGDGFEIVRRFAAQPGRGHIIVYSAYVTDVIRRHCHNLGADAVFHKEDSRQIAAHLEKLQSSHG